MEYEEESCPYIKAWDMKSRWKRSELKLKQMLNQNKSETE